MKNRFILFQRAGIFYVEDTTTGKQKSLRTRDRADAERLLAAQNEAAHLPAMNLQIAQVYLQHGDPQLATRTWQQVMEHIAALKSGPTRLRWQRAIRNQPLDLIRQRKLIETTADDFVAVLREGGVATNVYLRRIHHYAVTMHWLPWPVLPKRQWPPICYGIKRAITAEEHQKIVQRETNPALRAYYQLLWHLGGAQTDMANLKAEDVDWNRRVIAYRRCKTGTMSLISFGEEVAEILKNATGQRPFVPDAGQPDRFQTRPVFPAAHRNGRHQRRDLAQLPLRMGRTRESGGLSRTVRHAGFGPCQQDGASGLCEAGAGHPAAAGNLRSPARLRHGGCRQPAAIEHELKNGG